MITKDDYSLAIPSATLATSIANIHGCSTGNGDAFQLLAGEEGDILGIGRPERPRWRLHPVHQLRRARAHGENPKLLLSSLLGKECEKPAIGRKCQIRTVGA